MAREQLELAEPRQVFRGEQWRTELVPTGRLFEDRARARKAIEGTSLVIVAAGSLKRPRGRPANAMSSYGAKGARSAGNRRRSLLGERYGRLVVKAAKPSVPDGGAQWLCQCDCGRRIVTTAAMLRRQKAPRRDCGEDCALRMEEVS